MNTIWYVYVHLGGRSLLPKHVWKNEAPLIADFVLDLFQLWYVYVPKTIKRYDSRSPLENQTVKL